MATHRIPILGPNSTPETDVFQDRIGNQIAATNEIGNQLAFVLGDGAADVGIFANFEVPQNYVGTGKVIAKGILDGAMTSVTLGLGVQAIYVVDNEAGDAAYGTADLGEITTDHADKDAVTITITLSNVAPAAGDALYFYFFIDVSVTTYTGNLLLTDLLFEYADA